MSEPQRLFFAIDLPAEIREQIIHWRATHFPPEAGRPAAADNLHLTLAFLGEVSAEKEKALSLLALLLYCIRCNVMFAIYPRLFFDGLSDLFYGFC